MKSTKKSSLSSRFEMRIDEDTKHELEFCSSQLNITKTEVVKKGIKKVKEELKK